MSESSRKTIRVVAAVVTREGRYLITQRRPNAVLPLLWDFPGGRVEDGESDEEALARELLERLGAEVVVRTPWLSFNSHDYENYTVHQYVYECALESVALECRAVHAYRWVLSEEFDDYDFTPVDQASMNKLLGETE